MIEIQRTLENGYLIKTMSREEFWPLFQTHSKRFFDDDTQIFRLRDALSEDERLKLKELNKDLGKPFELRLGVYKENEFVGWHIGRQESFSTFYMQNSAIFPEHRRKGLYSQLTDLVLETAISMGFQSIYSRHNATNNAVIIPKLQKGFVITSMEISDTFGTLIHLSYFPNPLRRKMTDYRVGQIKPDEEIRRHLGL